MKNSLRISGLLAALWVVSGGVGAAGLGKMTVQSALGQPLRAEIELLSVQPEDVGAMRAELASAEAYRQARMERSEALRNLQFNIDRRADGRFVLRVSSSTPLSDPFLDMLIELNWSSGRVLREYTVLLDPPAPPKPPVAEIARPRAAAPVVESATRPVAAQHARVAEAPTERAERPAGPSARVYGPVRGGETLRRIAGKVQHADVTLEMMMASLYQANPQAFLNDNVNLLKKGQVLNIPDRDQVMRMYSPAQARALVREHTDRWQHYRGEVSETAAQRPPVATPDSGRVEVARPADRPAPAPSQDVLRLSKGEPAGTTADVKLTQRIQSLEEELAARNRALQEANERVSQLERTVKDLQRLLELRAQESGQPVPALPVEEPAPTPVEATPPAPVAVPAQPPSPPPAPAPEPEKGWMDTLLENPIYLGGGVAAVLLSILLGVMMASKWRRKDLASLEQSVMTGGDEFKTAIYRTGAAPAAAAAGAAAVGAATPSQVGGATDFSRLGLGSIDTHEVDPIAEAEVYMAYGRDAQAEEILKEALAKEPGRHEIALKLLEVYAARKDATAFETQASELYANLAGQDAPEWQKAAEMGRALDPANPLYAAAEPVSAQGPGPMAFESMSPEAAPAATAAPDLGFETPAEATAEAEPVAVDFSPEPVAAAEKMAAGDANMIEFDLTAPEESPAPAALDLEQPLEFEATPAPKLDIGAPAVPEPDSGIDLDFALPVEEAASTEAELELDMDIAELDLSQFEEALEIRVPAPAAEPELPQFNATAELEPPEAEAGLEGLPELSESPLDATAAPEVDELAVPSLEAGQEEAALADLSFADLDLSPPGRDAPEAAPAATEAGMPDLDFADLDLDLDLGAGSPEPASEPVTAAIPEFPEAEEIEMAPPPPADTAEAVAGEIDPELWEEVNTKLDLARAYLEMGDKEGAREILLEAQSEGDSKQKQEAARLLAETD